MKYIILNDLFYILKNKYKIIIKYLIAITLVFIMYGSSEYGIDLIFSTRFNFKEDHLDIMYMIFCLLNYLIYIYISLELFKKDLDNFDNMYLRISTTKWVISKIVINFLLVLIINVLIFLMTFIFRKNGIYNVFGVLNKIIFTLILIINTYNLLLTFNKSKLMFIIFLIPFTSILFININLLNLNIYIMLFILFIYILIIILISRFVKLSDLKE